MVVPPVESLATYHDRIILGGRSSKRAATKIKLFDPIFTQFPREGLEGICMKRTLLTCFVGMGIILAGYIKTAADKMPSHGVSKITAIR
jgi:hypothetical protein